MTTPDPLASPAETLPQPRPSAPFLDARAPLDSLSPLGALLSPPGWRGPALWLAGGLAVSEGLGWLLHLDGATVLGGAALAGGWWFLGRRRGLPTLRPPQDRAGWLERCETVLAQFERLAPEGGEPVDLPARREQLCRLREEGRDPGLSLALASLLPPDAALQPRFLEALRGPHSLRLHWGHALPGVSADWRWHEAFERCDLLLFHLRLPLRASDLRWLEAVPAAQPLWLLLEDERGLGHEALAGEISSLWPAADAARLLPWSGSGQDLAASLAPLTAWLGREGAQLPHRTILRRLEGLHGRWQAELEVLRRAAWQRRLQRSQWLVAAGVLMAPTPGLDLLVLACANGLMLQEMARLWDCPWQGEQLREAALELGRAALALGLVEWSSQALAGALRLHHAGWLVGGTLQALSAAYLTRVVGHAMADVLALSAGVSEPDLEAIKRQAPMLVARAAEAEKVDWAGFLEQGRLWLAERIDPRTGAPLQQTS